MKLRDGCFCALACIALSMPSLWATDHQDDLNNQDQTIAKQQEESETNMVKVFSGGLKAKTDEEMDQSRVRKARSNASVAYERPSETDGELIATIKKVSQFSRSARSGFHAVASQVYMGFASWEISDDAFTPLEHSGIEWDATIDAFDQCYRYHNICILQSGYRSAYRISTWETRVDYKVTVMAYDSWVPYATRVIAYPRAKEEIEVSYRLGVLAQYGIVMGAVNKGILSCKLGNNSQCYIQSAYLDDINDCGWFSGCETDAHAYIIGADTLPAVSN